ncbi:hypothetical protein NW764_015527 [Fusarium oxysporum]|nr:hypothetical protein NW764_015527 [Fusarium oxysporum]
MLRAVDLEIGNKLLALETLLKDVAIVQGQQIDCQAKERKFKPWKLPQEPRRPLSPPQLSHSVAGVKVERVSVQRSPSSPLPLSAAIHHYQGSEDEEDYRAAMAGQEEFRNKHSRSVANFDGSISVHGRAASTEHAGDLKQMKDKRQRKKEQAARELEERRKSLAECA